MASSRHHSCRDDDDCELTVFQRIGVTGEVVITPKIECGPITVTCLEGEIVPCDSKANHRRHKKDHDDKCRILIFQELCVEVPVRFKAKAQCELTGVACGPASLDPKDCLGDDHSGSDSSSDCTSDSSSDSSGDIIVEIVCDDESDSSSGSTSDCSC